MTDRTFDPTIGKQRPLAWLAAGELLLDGDWHSRGVLRIVMAAKSGMLSVSCRGMLEQARRAGILERQTADYTTMYRAPHIDRLRDQLEDVLRSVKAQNQADSSVVKA